MPESETEFKMVVRHVRQGLVQLTRQEARIVKIRSAGRSTGLAEEMLQILGYLQKEHEAHLDRLMLWERRHPTFRNDDGVSGIS